MYIFRGEIGYNNTKQMEAYKVMNMINKYEGMGKEEELSLDIAKDYSFGKSVGLVEELESSSSSPAKRRKLTPPTGPQQTCGRSSSTQPWAASPTTRSPGPGSRWRKSRALGKQQSSAGRSFLERNFSISDPAVENFVLSDGIEPERRIPPEPAKLVNSGRAAMLPDKMARGQTQGGKLPSVPHHPQVPLVNQYGQTAHLF
jgi:hypothetical protein